MNDIQKQTPEGAATGNQRHPVEGSGSDSAGRLLAYWRWAMPAFRIVYCRDGSVTPETITASFDGLDQACSVFAARGLKILYIAEQTPDRVTSRRPIAKFVDRQRREGTIHRPNSFPVRRFSGRALA